MNAQQIAENIRNNTSYGAKVWASGHVTRVYVTRELSKGKQDMGYIEIDADGNTQLCLTRNAAGIRDAAGL